MRSIRRITAAVAGAACLLSATPAWAPFHLVVIEQVFFGTDDCPDAQYVMLRTIAFGQVLVLNQMVNTQMADGTAGPAFGTFDKNLPDADSGVAMIIGTRQAEQLFGMSFDTVVDGRLIFPDGRVCFGRFGPPIAPVDCVAYGNFTGDNMGHGSPAAQPVLGQALVRVSETDSDVDDFELGAPAPENNAGDLGALGECPPTTACTGDCNADSEVTVDEIITGVNIALGDPLSGCMAMDADGSGDVTVDEIITALTNALEGCPA